MSRVDLAMTVHFYAMRFDLAMSFCVYPSVRMNGETIQASILELGMQI